MGILKRFKNDDRGQAMVEYGLIITLFILVVSSSLGGIGDLMGATFDKVVDVPIDSRIEVINTLIGEGYLPVADKDDLFAIGTVTERVWGKGTQWERDATGVENARNSKFIQVQNIDLLGIENLQPICDGSLRFTGIFNGGGYIIDNLKIDNGLNEYTGLFAYTDNALLENIGLENVDIKGGRFTGGLVGRQLTSIVKDSYVTGDVSGEGDVGVLVGFQQGNSKVINSHSSGNASGTSWVGGLVGDQRSNSTIENSYSSSNVNALENNIGGLVGYQVDGSKIMNSYATGVVTGNGNQVGGLLGFQNGMASVENSYATGEIVSTGNLVGGLVGRQQGNSWITNSYASGKVSGGSRVGGLVGYQIEGLVTDSYYDMNTTMVRDSDGGIGKSSNEMISLSTYNAWDSENVWWIMEGRYPRLR